MSYHFCLRPEQSPAFFNLSRYLLEHNWHKTRFNWRAHLSEKNFDFDAAAAECLEFKDKLAQLTSRFCPQVMPLTFCINDGNWPSVLHQLARLDQVDDLAWILKPAMLNNGQHIKIFQHLNQIEQHFLSPKRMGGEHVLQQYLSHPHLIKGPEKGHKYSLRMFVILTNYAGVFLYPQGYFNVALHPYDSGHYSDMSAHITNEHLKEEVLNVVQIPTTQYSQLFQPFYPQIKTIVTATISGLQQMHPEAFICKQQRSLAFFGFDFIVDADERVWLIEANHGPCFPTSDDHPLQKVFYSDFWQEVIANFVMPIAINQEPNTIQYRLFEPIINSH